MEVILAQKTGIKWYFVFKLTNNLQIHRKYMEILPF